MPRQPRYRFFTTGNPKGTITVKDRKYSYIGIIANYESGDEPVRKGLFTDMWRPLKFSKK